MRIALGADHAGVDLKNDLANFLKDTGIAFTDFGTAGSESVDYPDFAVAVARAVASGDYDRGLLVCGSGIGMAMAANKVPGIRAAVATEEESARLSRSHNNANVLALGARLTPSGKARDIVTAFLNTPFEGGRHQRRIDKLTHLDAIASTTDRN
ncbi:MAG: ribose 5-phosphate isomerase B [Acidobacteria bacterium]|jgi:ribose 5-phosphate isomerase B|nr:ribose 5-phosphate isomerase B [Acidobacteriota bacterium]